VTSFLRFAALSLFSLFALAAPVLPGANAQAPAWQVPRTPEGKPDLQGTWTNSSITTIERRDASMPLVLGPEQVKRMEASVASANAADAAPTDTKQGAPAAGGSIGGFNAFWLDRGVQVGKVKGTPRSSWIIDPPNGKMPVSAEGKTRIAAILARRSEEGPEGMNPADRCLVGSRGSGGPPMLNNIYNNTYQIVQTPGAVMIEVEMMHDARIIRMDETHKPAALHQWLGDSVGRWEGDTLVVETRNWKPDHSMYEPVFLSDQAVVTERFTRTAPDEILYEFAVNDPLIYTAPWKAEMVFTPSSGPVYEYACHEGNYALEHILAGARVAESRSGGKGK